MGDKTMSRIEKLVDDTRKNLENAKAELTAYEEGIKLNKIVTKNKKSAHWKLTMLLYTLFLLIFPGLPLMFLLANLQSGLNYFILALTLPTFIIEPIVAGYVAKKINEYLINEGFCPTEDYKNINDALIKIEQIARKNPNVKNITLEVAQNNVQIAQGLYERACTKAGLPEPPKYTLNKTARKQSPELSGKSKRTLNNKSQT